MCVYGAGGPGATHREATRGIILGGRARPRQADSTGPGQGAGWQGDGRKLLCHNDGDESRGRVRLPVARMSARAAVQREVQAADPHAGAHARKAEQMSG